MVQEFDLSDYSEARRLANAIKNNAEVINNDIFKRMDSEMERLSTCWQGQGASEVLNEYDKIKANYPGFCQKLINYSEHILAVTTTTEEAEDAAKSAYQNAG